MRRSEPTGDSGGSGWRKEAVETSCRIYNITENADRDLLYVHPANPNSRETRWMIYLLCKHGRTADKDAQISGCRRQPRVSLHH